jgi:hypothetical protein
MHTVYRSRHGAALLAGILLAAVSPALAEDETGGAPGAWLSTYTSARSLGLGGAFVGAADDAASVAWNPAGLSQLVPSEARFESARLFESSINTFSIAVPGSRLPSVGLSVLWHRSGDFEKTNELNDPLGTFNESESAYLFTVSHGFTPQLAVGVNAKLVHQSVEEFSGGGFGVDLGAVYDVTESFRLGASVLNVGGPSVTLRETEETYPTEIRAGAAASVLGERGLISAEIDVSDPGTRLHGGAEYWIHPSFALRIGMNDKRASGGMGFRFGWNYQFDYGVTNHPLGLTHRVGLSYRFGGFFATAKADPEVFSPTGETAVTKIHLNSRTKSSADSWDLAFISKSGEVVRHFGGKSKPPAHLLWDGKDDTGLPLPDGFYQYQLVVMDASGRRIESASRDVEIATGGPQGTVPAFTVR